MIDTADSRTQLTLENQAVAQLPLLGRNLVTLVTLAPGVSGLGTSAPARTPGSGADNFSTEESSTPAPMARDRTTISMLLTAST